jgi:DNA-binding beta-propeller fold protein YncE
MLKAILSAAILFAGAAAAEQVVPLPGSPFMTAVSADGRWVFVSLANSGLAVLESAAGRVELRRTLPVKGGLTGLVLTHDGKTLIGTDGQGVVLMNVKRLTSKTNDDPIAGVVHEPRAGAVYANVTRDDKLLFVSDEYTDSIAVIDLEKARSGVAAIIGKIPVGGGPIALKFSTDGRRLYTTSQTAARDWKWPDVCSPENANAKGGMHPEGAVVVVDVARTRTDPQHAVVSKVPAGCNPVRLTLSPDGERVYVTARGSHSVFVFNAGALTASPSNAFLGKVKVGTSPVPVIRVGKDVIVGNSNRFGANESANESGTLTVVDAVKLETNDQTSVRGTVEVGAFPRDLTLSPDGHTLYVANFGSRSLQVLDADHLPVHVR